jgi:hypothetical protein
MCNYYTLRPLQKLLMNMKNFYSSVIDVSEQKELTPERRKFWSLRPYTVQYFIARYCNFTIIKLVLRDIDTKTMLLITISWGALDLQYEPLLFLTFF